MTTATTQDTKNLVKFKNDNGEVVQFTSADVKKLICPQASDKDIALFMATCQKKRLDPIGSEDAYLVGYNTRDGFRAKMVTSYHVFNRRASANADYDGIESGVIVWNKNTNKIYDKVGTAFFPEAGEQLLGAWARVFFKSKNHPVEERVRLAEYSTNKGNWVSMPGTMLEKVAKSRAWRTAFPEDFQGLYEASEMDRATEERPAPQPVEATVVQQPQPQAQPQVQSQPTEQAPKPLTPEQMEYLQGVAQRLAPLWVCSLEDAKGKMMSTLGNPVGKDFTEYQAFCEELVKREEADAKQKAAEIVVPDAIEVPQQPSQQPEMSSADIQF